MRTWQAGASRGSDVDEHQMQCVRQLSLSAVQEMLAPLQEPGAHAGTLGAVWSGKCMVHA